MWTVLLPFICKAFNTLKFTGIDETENNCNHDDIKEITDTVRKFKNKYIPEL